MAVWPVQLLARLGAPQMTYFSMGMLVSVPYLGEYNQVFIPSNTNLLVDQVPFEMDKYAIKANLNMAKKTKNGSSNIFLEKVY